MLKQRIRIQNKKYLKDLLDDNIKTKMKEWKKGFKTGTSDPFFAEYIVMFEMHWSMSDIDEMSEFEFLSMQKLLQMKHSAEKMEQMKNKPKTKHSRNGAI